MTRLGEAAASFERTLEKLGITDDDEEFDAEELGRRGAVLAASDVLWHKHLGPVYSSSQVRQLMRVGTRQAVSDLAKRRRLLALPGEGGRLTFPAFQFGPNGRPLPGLPAILETFADAVESPYTVASWLVTSERSLQRKTPAEWLRAGRPPERVVQAASRYAQRLRR